MTYKPCPRCKRLIPNGMPYCQTCRPIAEQAQAEKRAHNDEMRRKRYNKPRPRTEYSAFYRSKAWRQTSRAKLAEAGWRCEAHLDSGCAGTAVEVHHIKPIQTKEGWDLRLEWSNLEAVCTHCHDLRHPEKLHRTPPGVVDLSKQRGPSEG